MQFEMAHGTLSAEALISVFIVPKQINFVLIYFTKLGQKSKYRIEIFVMSLSALNKTG